MPEALEVLDVVTRGLESSTILALRDAVSHTRKEPVKLLLGHLSDLVHTELLLEPLGQIDNALLQGQKSDGASPPLST